MEKCTNNISNITAKPNAHFKRFNRERTVIKTNKSTDWLKDEWNGVNDKRKTEDEDEIQTRNHRNENTANRERETTAQNYVAQATIISLLNL